MSASATASVTVNSAAATSVTLNNTSVSVTGAMAAGTVISTITVAPSGWTGTITLSGPDAPFFAWASNNGATNGGQVVVGSGGLPARATPYSITVTATP